VELVDPVNTGIEITRGPPEPMPGAWTSGDPQAA
jgi:hypothetical protein